MHKRSITHLGREGKRSMTPDKYGRIKLSKEWILGLIARQESIYKKNKYPTPKWMQFSLDMLERGYEVRYYDAVHTVSKYVYVKNKKNGIEVKVRFSNHKPNATTESSKDSDFYVGISNGGVITTEQVIPLVIDVLERRRSKE
jgi:competence CoiA-like predicted nuclease